MGKRKILIIDDEENLAFLMKANLERSGDFEIATARNGKVGLEMAKVTEYDLVITDYKMPVMDGKAVLEALRKMHPNLPIVIFSVYHDDDSTITRELRAQADGVISKPIDNQALSQVIEKALRKRT